VNGNRVLLNGAPLPNTYMVYNVTFDKSCGADPTSARAKKFAEASSKADELIFAALDQRQAIISAAHDLLMQGRGPLDGDDTYQNEEKSVLAIASFQAVADKIKANTGAPAPQAPVTRGEGIPAHLALVEPSDEERLAVSTYIDDLSRAGLQFGISLDATTLSSGIS
jgi:hypothetical protein